MTHRQVLLMGEKGANALQGEENIPVAEASAFQHAKIHQYAVQLIHAVQDMGA